MCLTGPRGIFQSIDHISGHVSGSTQTGVDAPELSQHTQSFFCSNIKLQAGPGSIAASQRDLDSILLLFKLSLLRPGIGPRLFPVPGAPPISVCGTTVYLRDLRPASRSHCEITDWAYATALRDRNASSPIDLSLIFFSFSSTSTRDSTPDSRSPPPPSLKRIT